MKRNNFRREVTGVEAYYLQNSHVQQWLDQIVEKLFTYCLLSGNDAHGEFIRGRQLVEKVAAELLTLSPLAEETLYEAVYQLVEQRLPDARVTGNFPSLATAMASMLAEGVRSALLNSGGVPFMPEAVTEHDGELTLANGEAKGELTQHRAGDLSASSLVPMTQGPGEVPSGVPENSSSTLVGSSKIVLRGGKAAVNLEAA